MINKQTFLIVIGLIFLCGALSVDVSAQTSSKKRTSRKKTTKIRTTVIKPSQVQLTPQVAPIEAEVVSTADGSQDDDNSTNSGGNAGSSNGAANQNVNNQSSENAALSNQVNTLTRKVTTLQNQQKSLTNLEKLSQAEQRAEALRQQLASTIEKEATLQARLEEINYQSTPENIERETAVYGSLRPEQVRDSRRKKLENEKKGVNDQLVQVQTNRVKLETAIASADNLVEKLRATVEADDTTNETPAKQTPTTEIPNSSGGNQPK